ncbi:HEAT repeat domain-containing protein [Planctomycetota bacterium]
MRCDTLISRVYDIAAQGKDVFTNTAIKQHIESCPQCLKAVENLTRAHDFAGKCNTDFAANTLRHVYEPEKKSPKTWLWPALAAVALIVIAITIYARKPDLDQNTHIAQQEKFDPNKVGFGDVVIRHIYPAADDKTALAVVSQAENEFNLMLLEKREVPDGSPQIHQDQISRWENYGSSIPDLYTQWRYRALDAIAEKQLSELASQGDSGALALLNRMSNDQPDNPFREKAGKILQGSFNRDINVLERLVATAADRKHPTRAFVIKQLGSVDAPMSYIALRRIAGDSSDPHRIQAVQSLAALKDRNSSGLLNDILHEQNASPKLHKEAEKALQAIQENN